MTHSESQKIIDAVIKGIAVFSNLEASEIGMDDNLEEDLLLAINTDVPAIIASVAKKLEIEVSVDRISDFIKQSLDDIEMATVKSLVAFIEEEVEFN